MKKFFVNIFFVFFILNSYTGFCNEIKESLSIADSLYEKKMYTQALEIYEEILNTGQRYTPSMLLKMAYINEGLGNIVNTTFYLNVYYEATSDIRALKKLEKLSEKKGMIGYEYNEQAYAANFIKKYKNELILFFSLVIIGFSIIYIYNYVKKKEKLIPMPVFIALFSLIILYLNFSYTTKTGIVNIKKAMVMDAPSSGANIISMLNGGSKIEIMGKKDVWLKTKLDGEEVYIKDNNVKLIRF